MAAASSDGRYDASQASSAGGSNDNGCGEKLFRLQMASQGFIEEMDEEQQSELVTRLNDPNSVRATMYPLIVDVHAAYDTALMDVQKLLEGLQALRPLINKAADPLLRPVDPSDELEGGLAVEVEEALRNVQLEWDQSFERAKVANDSFQSLQYLVKVAKHRLEQPEEEEEEAVAELAATALGAFGEAAGLDDADQLYRTVLQNNMQMEDMSCRAPTAPPPTGPPPAPPQDMIVPPPPPQFFPTVAFANPPHPGPVVPREPHAIRPFVLRVLMPEQGDSYDYNNVLMEQNLHDYNFRKRIIDFKIQIKRALHQLSGDWILPDFDLMELSSGRQLPDLNYMHEIPDVRVIDTGVQKPEAVLQIKRRQQVYDPDGRVKWQQRLWACRSYLAGTIYPDLYHQCWRCKDLNRHCGVAYCLHHEDGRCRVSSCKMCHAQPGLPPQPRPVHKGHRRAA